MCAVVDVFLLFLRFAILGRVLYAWVDPSPYPTNRLKAVLWGLTDPILVPLRRVVPPIGMFDFTPVIALVLLLILDYVARTLLCQPF